MVFYDGAAALATVTLVNEAGTYNAVATYLYSQPTVGTHQIGARYGGDASFSASSASQQVLTVTPATLSGVLSASDPSPIYGESITLTDTLTAGGTALNGTVTFFDGATALGQSTLNASGVASLAVGPLAVGTHSLTAHYGGDTDYPSGLISSLSLSVAGAPLTITANNTARVYGAANPAFTGTVSGAVLGDTFTETFSTTATAASIVGSYAIVPSVTGTNLANYRVTPVNGALTIVQAGSATTFALSNQNLTMTATVTSLTSGVPTGTVSFYQGQTAVGSGTLVNGAASVTASTFPAGDVVLSAQYSGDVNFTQSQSPPILVIAVSSASTSLTVGQSGSVADTVSVAPVTGFTGTIQFSCGGLPQASSCSFQPSSITFSGGQTSASVSLTIQTGLGTQAGMARPGVETGTGKPGALLAFMIGPGLFAMVIIAGKRKGGWSRYSLLLLLPLLLSVASCGGGNAATSTSTTSKTPSGTYTVQVIASGTGNLSSTTNISLTIQ